MVNLEAAERGLREQILQTAKHLFIQQGYVGLSMREIAEAVGVSKAALYYHFTDKEQLFVAILRANLDVLEKNIDAICEGGGSESHKLRLFVQYVLMEPADNRAVIRLASQEMGHISPEARADFGRHYHEAFIGKLAKIFADGALAGEFRSIDPYLAAWSLLGMLYPYFTPAQEGSLQVDDGVVDGILMIFLYGLATRG